MLPEGDKTLFFIDSKGDVRSVFLACVLHAWGMNPAAARVFCKRFLKATWRGHCEAIPALDRSVVYDVGWRSNCFLWIPKVTFGEFFWLVFCVPGERILLLFGFFASGLPRPCGEIISKRFQRKGGARLEV